MTWNYRVLKETEIRDNHLHTKYSIIEVYYDEEGKIESWCDCTDTILTTDDYEDLKDTAEYVLTAFSKPVLTLDSNRKLINLN